MTKTDLNKMWISSVAEKKHKIIITKKQHQTDTNAYTHKVSMIKLMNIMYFFIPE